MELWPNALPFNVRHFCQSVVNISMITHFGEGLGGVGREIKVKLFI